MGGGGVVLGVFLGPLFLSSYVFASSARPQAVVEIAPLHPPLFPHLKDTLALYSPPIGDDLLGHGHEVTQMVGEEYHVLWIVAGCVRRLRTVSLAPILRSYAQFLFSPFPEIVRSPDPGTLSIEFFFCHRRDPGRAPG